MRTLRLMFTAAVLAIACAAAEEAPAQDLYQAFREPSKSARPRVWWHWMNGNITKDGISKDLHWMHDAGIAGFHNFDAGLDTPQIVEHRIPYMTEEWNDVFRYALDVADSLDMEFTIASSPGWSETGGPWVSDDRAMKKLVWRQVEVNGPCVQSLKLPDGFSCEGVFQDDSKTGWDTDAKKDYYRDIAVVAVKLCDKDMDFSALKPSVSTSDGQSPAYAELNSDSVSEGAVLKADAEHNVWVQYEFPGPQPVRALTTSFLKLDGDKYAVSGELQCSDDGVTFRKVCNLGYQATIQRTYSFKEISARFYRIKITDDQSLGDCRIKLSQFILSSVSRIQDAGDKAGYGFYRLLYLEDTQADNVAASPDDVIDITDKFRNGVLNWTVPEGRWRIFRFGYSLTGKTNHPASAEATGLEVDKMDSAAVAEYLHNYLATYVKASGGRLGPDGISYMLTDSYEAGPQTWTLKMPEQFHRRKGYDLIKWLPALTGMVLGSTSQTERFLFDWRRCLGELMVEYHYDIQNKVLAGYGMKRYTEAHENYRVNPTDGMDCKRLADVPMSAFWMRYKQGDIFTPRFEADIRESASVAHIYGGNVAAAESFTSDGFRDGAWVFSPQVLKSEADAAMSCGLNRFIVHCSPHQPVDDKVPGLGLGKWGQWFDRHQTWAPQARVWTDYLSRSCELLQKGHYVADIAVYYGEDNNLTGIYLNNGPDVPDGYSFDYFNPTVLLRDASLEGNEIVVPGGVRYRALHLGCNVKYVSIEVLRKLKEYADSGVAISGTVPYALAGNSGTEQEFTCLVKDIWHSGRKNVQAGGNSGAQLAESGVLPDFTMEGKYDPHIHFVHRSTPEGEIYWISNRSDKTISFEGIFRTQGYRPEIYQAEDASRRSVSYRFANSRTYIPLTLTAFQSYFVVFTDKTLESSATVSEPAVCEYLTLNKPWKVTFQQGRGAPAEAVFGTLHSLSEDSDSGIKYFSGEATYTCTVKVKTAGFYLLDLGEVRDIAEITVNSEKVSTLWHTPYKTQVKLHKGINTLEIKVVNTWHNRIVGDLQPGVVQRVTYYPIDLLPADEPLLPSGLIGPVKICILK